MIRLLHFITALNFNHGRTIEWTQHKAFSTSAEIARVVEGNHENDSKEG